MVAPTRKASIEKCADDFITSGLQGLEVVLIESEIAKWSHNGQPNRTIATHLVNRSTVVYEPFDDYQILVQHFFPLANKKHIGQVQYLYPDELSKILATRRSVAKSSPQTNRHQRVLL